jgi:glycosyltransferase involved in cell wall biosynthesis
MRVSIVHVNLEGRDAIGQSILNQARFFRRKGDQVTIYLAYPPQHVPLRARSMTQVVSLEELVDPQATDFLNSDLYVYHYPGRYPLLESMKSLDRGAVIFYYHNVTPPELWGSAFHVDELRNSVAKAGTFAQYADLTVTPSQFNANQLVQDYGLDEERVRVLPLAVALEDFQPAPKPKGLLRRYGLTGKHVILFVGRMAGNKRIDLLVEALPAVRKAVPNAVLLLVGDVSANRAIEENVQRTRQLAANLGLGDAVTFAGSVERVSDYFHLADVYASASLHEGFGVPLIEAMASGVPVVASRATAHPEVVGDAGLLCEPGDAADLADKVIQVLTDDAFYGELVRAGLDRAQDFSLENYEAGWARIVAEATEWLPERPYPPVHRMPPTSLRAELPPAAAVPTEEGLAEGLQESADVMMRSYVVRSRLPLVGPLIAWIRRNLTSHLREPYLDPTLERQVGFNQRVVEVVRQLDARLARYEQQLAAQAEDRARIEMQLQLLLAEVEHLEVVSSGSPDADQLQALRQRIDELREQLDAGHTPPRGQRESNGQAGS